MIRRVWLALIILPCLAPLWGNSGGAEPRLSGAPGEGTCLNCHGDGLNYGPGGVQLTVEGGSSYVPGQRQRVTVVITDPAARAWGFEASPRVSSAPQSAGAGTLVPVDSFTQLTPAAGTLRWITHTKQGTRPGTKGPVTFQFDWIPPATDVGPVDFYVAANAANGNGQNDFGDEVYASSTRLTAAAPGKPIISALGVANAFSGATDRLAPGMWVTVYGTGLSTTTRGWAGADFANGIGPLSLDGVSATVDGKAAVVNYVSPGQVNVQIPVDAGAGATSLVVHSPTGVSDPYTLTLQPYAPTLLQSQAFGQFVVAQFADGTFAGPNGLIPGAAFRPARAGDTIVLYGIGFGPLQTPLLTGQIATGLDPTAAAVTFQIGGHSVVPVSAIAAPNLVSAYQFNVVVPPNLGAGSVPIDVSVAGVSTGQSLMLAVQ